MDREIVRIISKSLLGEIAPREQDILDRWVDASPENRETYLRLKDTKSIVGQYGRYEFFEHNRKPLDFAALNGRRNRPRRVRWIAACAAAAVLALVVGIWQFSGRNDGHGSSKAYSSEFSDMLGGNNSAILILSDGRVIKVEDETGKLNDGHRTISNTGGRLIYNETEPPLIDKNVAAPFYHTLRIPRGSVYHLVLADSTEVTLNSDSEIRYPVVFSGSERTIHLKGEAYFKVAKNAEKPFVVNCPHQTVRVLGTEFNIHAYPADAKAFTTLVEGSVEVASGDHRVVITPGVVSVADGRTIQTMATDISFNTSWIENRFAFDNESFTDILAKFERWYNVKFDVSGVTSLDNEFFTGYIPRFKHVESLFEVLESSMNLNFRKEGDVVVITLNN